MELAAPVKRRIGYGILDFLGGMPLFATAPLYRHWHMRWGATGGEVRASMARDDLVYAATSSDVWGGDFIRPSGRFGVGGDPARIPSSGRSYDEDLARRLWEVSERISGVLFTFAGRVPTQAVAMKVAGSKE